MRVLMATLSALALGALAFAAVVPAAQRTLQSTPSEAKIDTPAADVAEVRAEIDAMSETVLQQLLLSNEAVKAQYESAAGYAVFRATKGGFIVTGAGGTGVAVNKASGERTYVHLGSGGIGLGAGLQNYHPVFLFETEAALERFIAGSWDASTAAQAAAGKEGLNATSSFIDGIAVYQLTDKGLIAQADLTGTRFWKSEKLNLMKEGS